MALSTTMTERTPPRHKRLAPETSSGINGLIAACNKNDRFKLLEDDGVLPGNLDNHVHPMFHWFDCEGPMRQMLQLASHFITHESLLIFFVPLLYGRELTSTVGCTSKTYLSDPLASVCEEKRAIYLAGVREALHCLGHSVSFRFQPPTKRVYARTIRDNEGPAHTSSCCPAFQGRYSCRIELADYFRDYYRDGEYEAASLCAQFRHDFLFAATLIHEIVHAIGVMRRGNLNEPYIRVDCPETEWGYGWEHFMFGNVINPQDRTRRGTHLLMRKIWADPKGAERAGGKEYSDVPMSYIAQWFRKETWDTVAEEGPTAIPAPIAHFKIQSSNKFGAWIVSSDCAEIKQELIKFQEDWEPRPHSSSPMARSSSPTAGRARASRILWKLLTTEKLQRDNVPTAERISQRLQYDLTCSPRLHKTRPGAKTSMQPTLASGLGSVAACSAHTPIDSCVSRKRSADSQDDGSHVNKVRK
ncbi:hypothetical protein BDW02DRAFT_605194 [Decorospora gaudefroyi]|uniref:Uncharacterized protein n=1 Tax=Decorospora gaudefroyi TaxID=184978 RepID=A0A6A5KB09_9PLEO|nr:hypothetical protein BDW02DRAFT_605194 [Decorospora gaudefroyi]